MSYQKIAVSFLLLVTCYNILQAGDDNGTIYADTPQVFTRERLVDQRYAEYQWLQQQLTTDAQVTIQGIQDQRISSSFNFNNKVQIAPLPGTASGAAALTNAPSSTFQNFSPLTNAPTTNAAPLSPAGAVEATTEISPVDRVKFQQAYRDYLQSLSMQELLDDAHDLEGWTLYTLEFELTITPGAKVSQPAVVLIDVQAPESEKMPKGEMLSRWINQINLEIGSQSEFWYGRLRDQPDPFVVEKCLEAIHQFQKDPNGLPAYFNQIDKSVSTANTYLSSYKSTTATTSPQLTTQLSSLFADARTLSLTNKSTFDQAIQSTQGMSSTPTLAPPPTPPPTPSTVTNAGDVKKAEITQITDLLTDLIQSPLDGKKLFLNTPKDSTENTDQARTRASLNLYLLNHAARISTTYWYLNNLKPYIQADFHDSNTLDSKNSDQSNINIDDLCVAFKKGGDYALQQAVLAQAQQNLVVQSVEPDEYDQNISDTSTQEKMNNLSLALSAPLLKGINLESYLSYLSTSQDIFETIKRQPLLVSFGRGASQFGWLVGPQFQIIDRKVNFSHTDVKYHVTVSLEAPAWLHHLNIRGEYGWLDDDGHVRDRKWLWKSDNLYDVAPVNESTKPIAQEYTENTGSEDWDISPPGQTFNGTLQLRLPANESLMTAAVFQQPRVYREPLLDGPNNRLTIKTSSTPQTLLIRGKELWRNPKVVVGSTLADFVYLMPDMQSVLARFNSFQEQPPPGTTAFPLTVYTSFGRDEIDQIVNFNQGAPGENGIGQFATLATTVFVENKTPAVTFNLDASQIPKSYQKLQAIFRPEVAPAAPAALTPIDVSVSPDHTTANVGFAPSPSKTGNYFVDLLLTASPESLASIPVLQNGTAKMSYVAAADLVPTVSPTSTTFSNNTTSTQSLSISVPNLAALFTALPDLKTAVANNSAQLEVLDGGSPLKTKTPYLVTQSNGALSATLNASDFTPVTTAGTAKPFNLAILYSSSTPPWIVGTTYSFTVPAPPKP